MSIVTGRGRTYAMGALRVIGVAATLWMGARTALFGFDLARIGAGSFAPPHRTAQAVGRLVHPITVRDSAGLTHRLDLGNGRALVLLFDHECRFCGLNMSRWLELLADLPRDVSVYALAIGDARTETAYFRGLHHRVQVYTFARDSSILEEFGTEWTPTTVAVVNGHVASVIDGVLAPVHQASVLSALRRHDDQR